MGQGLGSLSRDGWARDLDIYIGMGGPGIWEFMLGWMGQGFGHLYRDGWARDLDIYIGMGGTGIWTFI